MTGRRVHIVSAIAAVVVALAIVTGWALSVPEPLLRDRLMRWQFWAFELQFIVLAGATCHQLRQLVRSLALPVRTWLLLGAIGLTSATLVGAVAPRTSRILFDEQIYQGIGQSLADTRVAQMCNDGTVEYGRLQCWSGEYNKQPHGYPYVLSVAYRIAGARPWLAPAVNNAATVALVGVVFLIVALVFGDARAAITSAIMMTAIPMALAWGNTGAAEPTAALACAVAVLAAFQFVSTRTTAALIWMVSATTFAASFRPECLLVVPLVATIILLKAATELRQPRLWWSAAAAALAGWNVVAHVLAVRHESWGTSGERMSVSYVGRNLSTNGLFYVWDERFPVLLTLLALVGLVTYRKQRAVWALLAYLGVFWGVFLFFYAGSYDYGADVRYSVMTYPPIAVLAGLGGAAIVTGSRNLVAPGALRWAAAALLLFHLSLYLPLVRAEGEEAWAARADVAFVNRAVKSLPPESVVLTHIPSLFLLRGVNAAQTSIATDNTARVAGEFFERYPGGVYLHWNFWCNVADPGQQAFCIKALAFFDHELVVEDHVRNYRFALYRLRMPRGESEPASAAR